jgi:osmoprotectant transport system ATP-binding protein
MSAIVSFQSVLYRIGAHRILDGFSLEVASGETVVLLGRSGSGKTTALKMVNGLIAPTGGEVAVEGRATSAWDPIRLRRGIGYVIQEVGLFPHFTVAENVGLVPRLEGWPPERIQARVEHLLQQVDLDPARFGARYPRELSGGQRQRVGVARALAADPGLLLFDEPFGALDPINRLEMQQLFLHLRKSLGKTALFVTHDVREALLLGSRIALLHDGRAEFTGTPEELTRARGAEVEAFLACLGREAAREHAPTRP